MIIKFDVYGTSCHMTVNLEEICKTEGQKVVAGSRERKEQARYNMELVYVQDADQAGTESVMGACCPNCGAPIRNLGRPVCEYCGTAVTLINEKVWKLQSFKED